MRWAYNQVIYVLNNFNNILPFVAKFQNNIINAINNNDKKLALNIVKECNLKLLETKELKIT